MPEAENPKKPTEAEMEAQREHDEQVLRDAGLLPDPIDTDNLPVMGDEG